VTVVVLPAVVMIEPSGYCNPLNKNMHPRMKNIAKPVNRSESINISCPMHMIIMEIASRMRYTNRIILLPPNILCSLFD